MSEQVAEAMPVIVVLPTEIDVTNSEEVLHKLSAALAPGVTLLIADLTSTAFCDTSGVRALVSAQERATAADARLRVAVSPGGSVRRVLELTGLIRLLTVYPSVHEAMSAG
jgi:anti-sigma B factor antagonist